MIWKTKYIYVPQYNYVSTNQHGDRYKKSGSEQLKIVELSLKACEPNIPDLQQLILLGHHIGHPVKYEFSEPQHTISIELVSADKLRKLL